MAARGREHQLVLVLNEHSCEHAVQAAHQHRHDTAWQRLAGLQAFSNVEIPSAVAEDGEVPQVIFRLAGLCARRIKVAMASACPAAQVWGLAASEPTKCPARSDTENQERSDK
jgi:hypothetical protein